MDYSALNNKLCAITIVNTQKIINETIPVNNFSFMRLRDVLIKTGKILSEDFDHQVYIASIKGGFAKRNNATVAFQLLEDKIVIAAYADEGLINQHTCEGVINEFKRTIADYTPGTKQ